MISFQNFSFRYEESKDFTLRGIDMTVQTGEFILLTGRSGCGKTTTLRIIGGFETPDAGDVFFDGKRINDLPPYRRQVNTVFQKYALFPHLTYSITLRSVCGSRKRRTAKSETGSRKCWSWSTCAGSNAAGWERFPADSSSGLPLRARWSTSRRSCSWTSP